MLGVVGDALEDFGVPLGMPVGEVAHAGEQEVVRARVVEASQFMAHVFGTGEVGGHAKPAAVVASIAIAAPDGTPDDDIHILDKRFDTLAHGSSL